MPVAQSAELERVGRGDERGGYENIEYVTDSRRIGALGGKSARLHSLAANPPVGLPPLAAEQPVTAAGIELGRRLFFDRRLSFNDTLSCAMCHVPEQGFTQNELATPVGIEGRSVKRNAPALYNVAYREALFFDGREENLEQQIWSPLLAANEMGNPSVGTVLRRLRATGEYAAAFQSLYGEGITMGTLGRALADYQRAMQTGRRIQLAPGVFVERNDDTALPKRSDLGRYEATGQAQDRWKFRTPFRDMRRACFARSCPDRIAWQFQSEPMPPVRHRLPGGMGRPYRLTGAAYTTAGPRCSSRDRAGVSAPRPSWRRSRSPPPAAPTVPPRRPCAGTPPRPGARPGSHSPRTPVRRAPA